MFKKRKGAPRDKFRRKQDAQETAGGGEEDDEVLLDDALAAQSAARKKRRSTNPATASAATASPAASAAAVKGEAYAAVEDRLLGKTEEDVTRGHGLNAEENEERLAAAEVCLAPRDAKGNILDPSAVLPFRWPLLTCTIVSAVSRCPLRPPSPPMQRKRSLQAGALGTDKTYRGQAAYKQYVGKSVKGPLLAPTNVRSSVRMDYQPDICTDYKKTGYCGYGDSCVFMHDRSEYKGSWQVEKEWLKEQEDKAKALEDGGEAKEEDEDEDNSKHRRPAIALSSAVLTHGRAPLVPFACLICERRFTFLSNAVVTPCEHYFCEKVREARSDGVMSLRTNQRVAVPSVRSSTTARASAATCARSPSTASSTWRAR